MAKKFGKLLLLTAGVGAAAAAAYYYLQKKDSGILLKRKDEEECDDFYCDSECDDASRTYVELNRECSESPETAEAAEETVAEVEEFFSEETATEN